MLCAVFAALGSSDGCLAAGGRSIFVGIVTAATEDFADYLSAGGGQSQGILPRSLGTGGCESQGTLPRSLQTCQQEMPRQQQQPRRRRKRCSTPRRATGEATCFAP